MMNVFKYFIQMDVRCKLLCYRFQGYKFWCSPRQLDHGLVAVKVGFHNDDLIARVDMAKDGGEQGFIGSIRHQDFLQRVDLAWPLQQVGVEFRQGIYQSWMTLNERISK